MLLDHSLILAVGAAGRFAGLAFPALAKRGAKVHGTIRHASEAKAVRVHGAAKTCFTRVDYRDLAEVAAMALTEDRLKFGTFEHCAEDNLNRRGVAALVGDVLVWPLEAVKLEPNTIPPKAGACDDAWKVDAIRPMFDRHGLLSKKDDIATDLMRDYYVQRATVGLIITGRTQITDRAHPIAEA